MPRAIVYLIEGFRYCACSGWLRTTALVVIGQALRVSPVFSQQVVHFRVA
jgi:hypothetical protein